jgi:hypothetical protein
MFGYNYPYQSSDTVNNAYNTNDPVTPLRAAFNFTVDQWWGHGRLDYPPNEGDFLELEAGGVYTGELACNRADSMMRDPVRNDVQPDHACGVSLPSYGTLTSTTTWCEIGNGIWADEIGNRSITCSQQFIRIDSTSQRISTRWFGISNSLHIQLHFPNTKRYDDNQCKLY